jgi:hypothetical protein
MRSREDLFPGTDNVEAKPPKATQSHPNASLTRLSLPISFSHMHQTSIYSFKTLEKQGAICSAPVRATRRRGTVANLPRDTQGTASSVYFITP